MSYNITPEINAHLSTNRHAPDLLRGMCKEFDLLPEVGYRVIDEWLRKQPVTSEDEARFIDMKIE